MKVYIYNIKNADMEMPPHAVSKERIEKSMRLKFENDRRRSLGVEILLNHAVRELCERHGIVAEVSFPVTLRTDQYAKPHIVFANEEIKCFRQKGIFSDVQETLEFSVSHSGDYVALILADDCDTEVGIDIEEHQEQNKIEQIAKRFFTEEEYGAIDSVNRFYMYWTLKESFLKAIGRGLSYPMNQFSVSFEENQEYAIYHQTDFTGSFYGRVLPLAAGYSLSVCVKNAKEQLKQIEMKELS